MFWDLLVYYDLVTDMILMVTNWPTEPVLGARSNELEERWVGWSVGQVEPQELVFLFHCIHNPTQR